MATALAAMLFVLMSFQPAAASLRIAQDDSATPLVFASPRATTWSGLRSTRARAPARCRHYVQVAPSAASLACGWHRHRCVLFALSLAPIGSAPDGSPPAQLVSAPCAPPVFMLCARQARLTFATGLRLLS